MWRENVTTPPTWQRYLARRRFLWTAKSVTASRPIATPANPISSCQRGLSIPMSMSSIKRVTRCRPLGGIIRRIQHFVRLLTDWRSRSKTDALPYASIVPEVALGLSRQPPRLSENPTFQMLRLVQFLDPIVPNLFQRTTVGGACSLLEKARRLPTVFLLLLT